MLKSQLTDELHQYCLTYGVREHPVLVKLRQESEKFSNKQMLISPDQGALMAMLAQLMNAQSYLEIGTFTGYSTLWMALAMPVDAQITTIDLSARHLDLAQTYWQEAQVATKITPLIAPAEQSLQQLCGEKNNYFDIALIDANKSQYIEYYELCLNLVRPGGLIIIDNVLMYAQVLEDNPRKNYVKILQTLNRMLKDDSRIDLCLLPVGDGMTLARKRTNNETKS